MRTVILAAIAISLCVGCATRSLDGRWQATIPDMSVYPPGSIQYLEFGNGRIKSELVVPYANGKGVLTATGTYTLEGDTCTSRIENVEYSEEFKKLCALRVVPQVDEAGVRNAMNRDPIAKVVWQDDETVQLQAPSNTMTLTRIEAE